MTRFRHVACLTLLLCWGLALPACSDHAARDRVKTSPLTELLARAGWERIARAIPPSQTVEQTLASARTPYRWEVRREGALTHVVALPQDPALGKPLSFVVADNTPVFPAADAGGAFLLGLSPVAEPGPLARLDRLHQTLALHNGDVRYRWAGCLLLQDSEPVSDLELRGVLLTVDPEGTRAAWKGKTRRTTRRSGIPRHLAPGEFFCTEIDSGKLPKDKADQDGLSAVGVLEATWLGSKGQRRFATLSAQPLDWRDFRQVSGEPFAVIRGGTLDTADREAVMLPDPSLVVLIGQEGNRLLVRTADGVQGIITPDRLIARFPSPSPELAGARYGLLSRFIRHAVAGEQPEALALYPPTLVETRRDALAADLARRYPARPDAEVLTPVIQTLALVPTDVGEVATVFVWLKEGHRTVWTTLDSVVFAGEDLHPISPTVRVIEEAPAPPKTRSL